MHICPWAKSFLDRGIDTKESGHNTDMSSQAFDERIACPNCGIHFPTLGRLKHHTTVSHPNPGVIVLDEDHTTIDLREGLVRLRRI